VMLLVLSCSKVAKSTNENTCDLQLSTCSLVLVNLPADISIWRQFINKPRTRNLYSNLYCSIGKRRNIDDYPSHSKKVKKKKHYCNGFDFYFDECNSHNKTTDWIKSFFGLRKKSKKPYYFDRDLVISDFQYYLAYKSTYFTLRVPVFKSRFKIVWNNDNCSRIFLAGLHASLGYNIIHKKDRHLGLKIISTIPTRKQNDCFFDTKIDNGILWGIGAGITGSYTLWESKKSNNCYLDMYVDAKAQYMSKSSQKKYFCMSYHYDNEYYKENMTLYANVKINTLANITAMFELIKANWNFDFGYTLYTHFGEKIIKKLPDKIDIPLLVCSCPQDIKICVPTQIRHNIFMGLGYAGKKEQRKVTPFIGFIVEFGINKQYKEIGTWLKGGLSFG